MRCAGGEDSVHAGAGIVADFVPWLECQESLTKAKAVMGATDGAREM